MGVIERHQASLAWDIYQAEIPCMYMYMYFPPNFIYVTEVWKCCQFNKAINVMKLPLYGYEVLTFIRSC